MSNVASKWLLLRDRSSARGLAIPFEQVVDRVQRALGNSIKEEIPEDSDRTVRITRPAGAITPELRVEIKEPSASKETIVRFESRAPFLLAFLTLAVPILGIVLSAFSLIIWLPYLIASFAAMGRIIPGDQYIRIIEVSTLLFISGMACLLGSWPLQQLGGSIEGRFWREAGFVLGRDRLVHGSLRHTGLILGGKVFSSSLSTVIILLFFSALGVPGYLLLLIATSALLRLLSNTFRQSPSRLRRAQLATLAGSPITSYALTMLGSHILLTTLLATLGRSVELISLSARLAPIKADPVFWENLLAGFPGLTATVSDIFLYVDEDPSYFGFTRSFHYDEYSNILQGLADALPSVVSGRVDPSQMYTTIGFLCLGLIAATPLALPFALRRNRLDWLAKFGPGITAGEYSTLFTADENDWREWLFRAWLFFFWASEVILLAFSTLVSLSVLYVVSNVELPSRFEAIATPYEAIYGLLKSYPATEGITSITLLLFALPPIVLFLLSLLTWMFAGLGRSLTAHLVAKDTRNLSGKTHHVPGVTELGICFVRAPRWSKTPWIARFRSRNMVFVPRFIWNASSLGGGSLVSDTTLLALAAHEAYHFRRRNLLTFLETVSCLSLGKPWLLPLFVDSLAEEQRADAAATSVVSGTAVLQALEELDRCRPALRPAKRFPATRRRLGRVFGHLQFLLGSNLLGYIHPTPEARRLGIVKVSPSVNQKHTAKNSPRIGPALLGGSSGMFSLTIAAITIYTTCLSGENQQTLPDNDLDENLASWSPTKAPESAPVSMLCNDKALFFATKSQIYRYELLNETWSSIEAWPDVAINQLSLVDDLLYIGGREKLLWISSEQTGEINAKPMGLRENMREVIQFGPVTRRNRDNILVETNFGIAQADRSRIVAWFIHGRMDLWWEGSNDFMTRPVFRWFQDDSSRWHITSSDHGKLSHNLLGEVDLVGWRTIKTDFEDEPLHILPWRASEVNFSIDHIFRSWRKAVSEQFQLIELPVVDPASIATDDNGQLWMLAPDEKGVSVIGPPGNFLLPVENAYSLLAVSGSEEDLIWYLFLIVENDGYQVEVVTVESTRRVSNVTGSEVRWRELVGSCVYEQSLLFATSSQGLGQMDSRSGNISWWLQ